MYDQLFDSDTYMADMIYVVAFPLVAYCKERQMFNKARLKLESEFRNTIARQQSKSHVVLHQNWQFTVNWRYYKSLSIEKDLFYWLMDLIV